MTLLGVLGGQHRALAEPGGGLRLAGVRVSWWVGVGDAWHRPADEVAVRTTARRGTPVLDTAWRVAGGDLRSETYAAVIDGAEWVVLELHNATRVPVTVALVVAGDAPWRTGRRAAAPWRLDGGVLHGPGAGAGPLVVLGRRPDAWCEADDPDALLTRLAAGDTLLFDAAPGAGAGGGAAVAPVEGTKRCAAVVFALTHGSSRRVLLSPAPAGPSPRRRPPKPPSAPDPTRAPAAEAVARGWRQQLGAGCRIDLADDAVDTALTEARAQLLLAEPSGRLDGAFDAAALAALGHHQEAAAHLDAVLAALRPPVAADDARRLLVGVTDVVRWSPDAAALAPVLLRHAAELAAWADPRRRGDPVASWGLAAVARRAGEPAPHLAARSSRRDGPGGAEAAGPASVSSVDRSSAPAWLRSSTATPLAAEVLERRAEVVDDDVAGVIELLPGWQPSWRGRAIEVHGLPCAAGTLSFALRWHGPRPALLWQLERAEGAEPVALRCPSIDPAFHSEQPDGEALLAAPGVAPAVAGGADDATTLS